MYIIDVSTFCGWDDIGCRRGRRCAEFSVEDGLLDTVVRRGAMENEVL